MVPSSTSRQRDATKQTERSSEMRYPRETEIFDSPQSKSIAVQSKLNCHKKLIEFLEHLQLANDFWWVFWTNNKQIRMFYSMPSHKANTTCGADDKEVVNLISFKSHCSHFKIETMKRQKWKQITTIKMCSKYLLFFAFHKIHICFNWSIVLNYTKRRRKIFQFNEKIYSNQAETAEKSLLFNFQLGYNQQRSLATYLDASTVWFQLIK